MDGFGWNPSDPNGGAPDDQRLKVAQALLAQQGGGSGAFGAVAQLAKAYGAAQLQQRMQENGQTKALGMTPQTFPAFDDSGGAMPRGPGMMQPGLLDKLQAFFSGGG